MDSTAPRGEIDYTLRLRATLADLRAGRIAPAELRDGDVYLRRAAEFHGVATELPCPLCEDGPLREVSWIFGDDLGSADGSARTPEEIRRLADDHDEFTVHVVRFCPACEFHHLTRSYVVGLEPGTGRRLRAKARRAASGTSS